MDYPGEEVAMSATEINKNDLTEALEYDADTRYMPIPPQEASLQSVTAKPWLKVDANQDLEGMTFDKDGNLYFVEAYTSRLHRVDIETKKDEVIFEDPLNRSMSAVKIHQDGRIFIPSVGPAFDHGFIFVFDPKTGKYDVLLEGHVVDDMVFDSKGGFYYTHFAGNLDTPNGGVYYVTPDLKTVEPLLSNLAGPNGVGLSKDENTIWISETCSNRLLRVGLDPNGGPTDIAPFAMTCPYYFTGGTGPDSIYIDDDDNVYVALYGSGRVMVFNRNGYPIGQILLQGREEGKHTRVTHPTIRPGTREIYICTNDEEDGASIFRAGAFATANTNGFHLK